MREFISREGVSQVIVFSWNVLAHKSELECALNEGKTSHEVHCVGIFALACSDNVNCRHIIAEGSDRLAGPAGSPNRSCDYDGEELFHCNVEGCSWGVIPLYLEPVVVVKRPAAPSPRCIRRDQTVRCLCPEGSQD